MTDVTTQDAEPPRKRAGPLNSPWRNEDICKRVKALWKDHTASQIATKIWTEFKVEISRNSVVGFLHREKLTVEQKSEVHPLTRSAGITRPRVQRITPVNVQSINAAVQKINAVKAAPKVKPEPFIAACVEIAPLHLSMMDLTEETCRWPYGETNFTYCGHTALGGPYCAAHATIAYQPRQSRRGGVPPSELGKAKGGVFGRVA